MNAKWFRARILDLGLSQRQFAKKLKIDPGSLTLTLQGRRRLKTEEAALMARLFGVELTEVLEAAGVRLGPAIKDVAVAIKGVAGEGLFVSWGNGKASVKASESFGSGVEAVRLETTGTGYDGLDGATAFYRPRPGVDPEAVGRLAIVTMKDGRVAIRVVRRGYGPGKYNLTGMTGEILERDVDLISAWSVINLRL